MPRRAYIPGSQNALLAFALNAAGLLVPQPFRFGATPAEAATFNSAVQDYKTKMDAVNNPATKTKAAVAAKNESKLMMLYVIRPLLQYIKDNAGVATEDKIALGLNPGDIKPAPVPQPTSVPVLNVLALAPRQHILRYRDITTPDRRAKPDGVFAIELYCLVGDTPPADPTSAKFLGLATKQSYTATFNAADVGKIAFYLGRWINDKAEPGPFSQPVGQMISS